MSRPTLTPAVAVWRQGIQYRGDLQSLAAVRQSPPAHLANAAKNMIEFCCRTTLWCGLVRFWYSHGYNTVCNHVIEVRQWWWSGMGRFFYYSVSCLNLFLTPFVRIKGRSDKNKPRQPIGKKELQFSKDWTVSSLFCKISPDTWAAVCTNEVMFS